MQFINNFFCKVKITKMITNVFVCFFVIIYSRIIFTNFFTFGQWAGTHITKLYIYRLVSLCSQIGRTASIRCCTLVHCSYNHVTRRTIKSSYATMNLKGCCCSVVAKVITTAVDFTSLRQWWDWHWRLLGKMTGTLWK